MTLLQLFNLAHKKSYYSRSDDEVWAALSGATQNLYKKVLKESRGFFIVWDTSSIALIVGQEEYALPAACTQLLRVREQQNSTSPWRVCVPSEGVSDTSFEDLGPYGFESFDSSLAGGSEFTYVTYLKMTDAETTAQVEAIRFEPPPYDTRNVELVYVARFIEITGGNSPKFMPVESDQCVLYGAVARLLGDNGDDPSIAASIAHEEEVSFLDWVRRRQFQTAVTKVTPYVDDLD